MPGSMGSCTSLSPVLENKPDLSSHLPPAFSLGIRAGGEPGPPPPLHPLPLGAAGGQESGAHGWPRGKAADGDCAKAAAWGGERGGALRLPQLLGFAALLLLAVVASLAVWPHVSAHGGSGSPHALHAAAAGLAARRCCMRPAARPAWSPACACRTNSWCACWAARAPRTARPCSAWRR